MNQIILDHISRLELGDCLEHGNMSVLPLFVKEPVGPEYLTLGEALDANLFLVTEVDESGSVPNLAVFNQSDRPVLILDGEELKGAKQNRVLNTTVLVAAGAKIVIPVSCTEQGRWSYNSRGFSDSEVVMHSSGRARKCVDVSTSLAEGHSFAGDQGAVWEEVDVLSRKTQSASPTSAMRQAFEDRQQDLEQYGQAFTLVEGQAGVLVMIDGKVVGFDLLSRPEAYARLHEKLVRSYAMDALTRTGADAPSKLSPATDPAETARTFLDNIQTCREERFDSVGLGADLRFAGDSVVGSGLLVDVSVVHTAFFWGYRGGRGLGEGMSRSSARMWSRLLSGDSDEGMDR
ncbi:MAG: DUF6569 family protein [bacterium]